MRQLALYKCKLKNLLAAETKTDAAKIKAKSKTTITTTVLISTRLQYLKEVYIFERKTGKKLVGAMTLHTTAA